jgi:predicted nuclease of predicted toxin-antitoxin system
MADELAALYGRLYLDQDVPVQLAGMLRAQGVDVVTTLEAGVLGQSDAQQLADAVTAGRVLVTHNRLDYEELHTAYLADDRPHFGIIIAAQRRSLRLTRDRLLDLLNRFDRDQLRNNLFYA